jgi:hypothetical protein
MVNNLTSTYFDKWTSTYCFVYVSVIWPPDTNTIFVYWTVKDKKNIMIAFSVYSRMLLLFWLHCKVLIILIRINKYVTNSFVYNSYIYP